MTSVSASASSLSSSCSSSLTPQCKHDVFLSFRGEDTRDNFTSHLFAALCRKKIKTFIDEEVNRGDEISHTILNAIEGSKISIIIFSKNYASSKWCLDELVKILECKNLNGQIVVPVFYHVDPSDVRKQTESFADAFVELEKQFLAMPEKVQKWRAVLIVASNLSGWDTVNIRPEAKLVEEITKDIFKKLKDKSFSGDFKGLVGLNSRIKQIKSLLCMGLPEFRIVGIWGMGGIGKTTIAGAIFNQISPEFERDCFITYVREESERSGLIHLRERILSEILEENLKIGTPDLPEYIKERLQGMRVFIILDDVNKPEQLYFLTGGLDRLDPGSRIIVTTRDKRVLDECGVDKIYEVEGLNREESLELFSNFAFKQKFCPRDFLLLSKSVVDYANGNPLALKVLGSFFRRKSKLEWENALKNLRRISDQNIYDVLKISYNELKQEEKSLFLDIACFFKGEDKEYMKMIQDDPYSVDYELNVLVDKSLVIISCYKKLQMHDLLQEMGREIVRQESVREPAKRSRLWYYEDVYNVLKKNKGTVAIEGIFLDLSKIRDLYLVSGAFVSMSNLRLLKFYMPNRDGVPIMNSKVHLQKGLEYLPEELRYLHWHGYPLKTLPSNFDPENLLTLSLPYSKVEQIWPGKKEALKLKSIDLHHSKYLTWIPNHSEVPNLERLNLQNCTNLPYIPAALKNFNNLRMLCLKGCESLKRFPSNVHFTSPITIDFSCCDNLTQFPKISGNIIELRLCKTPIKEVPSSIESLGNLQMLDLRHCTKLKSLPTSICKLKSLNWLHLCYCYNLKNFPEILEKMDRLEYIGLASTGIKVLPSSIEHLRGLKELWLGECSELDTFPESLGNLRSLKYLNVDRSAISQLPSSIAGLNKLEDLSFFGCRGLVLPPVLSGLSSLKWLELRDCDLIEIPQDIGSLSALEWLVLSENNFQDLPTSIKKLSRLMYLNLSSCYKLRSLPELPICLICFDARNCKQLQTFPEIPTCLEELDGSILEALSRQHRGRRPSQIYSNFTNCLKLNGNAYNILADLQLRLFNEKKFDTPCGINICLPGSEIPDWFSHQSSGSSITIQLQQHCCNRIFIGFALCAVIEFPEDSEARGEYFHVRCDYHCESKHVDEYCHLVQYLTIDSDHVILGFQPCLDIQLPYGDHHEAAVSFQFLIENKNCHQVKRCGVNPVYANPNKTKPSTFTIQFATSSEEECSEIRKLRNGFNDKASSRGTTESIRRKISNEHQQQSCLFPLFFRNRGGFLAFLIFVHLLFILSRISFHQCKE